MLYQQILKRALFRMDPERAHNVAIGSMMTAAAVPGLLQLARGVYGVPAHPELATELWGIRFPHPVGLAAGLDKNGAAYPGFASLGFGFMEVGTVTPRPQAGNEQPRLFRLPPDEALINRMGFNNAGAEAMARSLAKLARRPIPLAVNIGKNKTTPNEQAEEDYRACIRRLYPYGDFFVVNISSPNTPDLRNLQHGEELKRLLDAVMDEMRRQAASPVPSGLAQPAGASAAVKPVLVKIAPDLSESELAYMTDTIMQSGVSGIIATNTTLSRDGLTHAHAGQAGGLSGRPLTRRSTEIIRQLYRHTGGKLPIIGVGGIFTAEDAYEKIRAGASLVEVYSGFIYKGPGMMKEICGGLGELLRRDGFSRITEAVGIDHNR